MSIAISVRRATPEDAPALAHLINRAYEVEAFFVDGPRVTAAEVAELTQNGVFLVLEHGALAPDAGARGGLAAAVLLHPEDAEASDRASIQLVSVAPELQRLGLGTRLVRIAEAMAEAMGAGSVGLRIVNLRGELARWYRRLGYREIGVTPYVRPAKRACHFVELARDLSPASWATIPAPCDLGSLSPS